MRLSIATKQVLTWLACLAVLFGALAPAVSHALQGGAGDPLRDICSASPAASSDGTSGKPAPGGEIPFSMQHCPYCTLHAPDLAPAPATCGTVILADLAIDPPALFLVAPRTLHAWASANPRAPPLHA